MSIGHHLLACGKELPARVSIKEIEFKREKVFKHDFFAATLLFESLDGTRRIVLKVNRIHHFLGMPISWIGKWLCEHELSIMERLSGIKGVPTLLDRFGPTGYAYEYIEGKSLDDGAETDNEFWDKLVELVKNVHDRDVIYMDMNKKGNILRRPSGEPGLIDFQISMHVPIRKFLSRRVTNLVRQIGFESDMYHVYKHKRRLCPEALTEEERALSKRRNPFIDVHRQFANPYKFLRRRLFGFLYKKGWLKAEDAGQRSSENDPARFVEKY